MKNLYCEYLMDYLFNDSIDCVCTCYVSYCRKPLKQIIISYKHELISLNTICGSKECLNKFLEHRDDNFIYYLVDCDPIEDAMNKKEEINKYIEKVKKATILL